MIYNLQYVQHAIKPLQEELKNHSLYSKLESFEDIKVFMQAHVFAVWDFMSLLKYLQINLTTVQTPWVPSENTEIVRFLNEIVFGEESDLNELGEARSHFEMYRDAMQQAGASTARIDLFIQQISEGKTMQNAFSSVVVNPKVQDFVLFTESLIQSDQAHKAAAAFTFGRENLIPDMFYQILEKADPDNGLYSKFRFYLDRHIEVDGDEHGPLSLQLVKQLCGKDESKWISVLKTADTALRKRIALWDAIEEDIAAYVTL